MAKMTYFNMQLQGKVDEYNTKNRETGGRPSYTVVAESKETKPLPLKRGKEKAI